MSAIPSWARVGAKVVCVMDGPMAVIHPGSKVYTITGAGYFGCTKWHIVVDGACELASRFRPLITLEHDMAVHFSALLDVPASHEVDA